MSDTSLGRQTSDVAAAKMIAMAAKDRFAWLPPTVDLAEAVQHTRRPGKVGTGLIHPW
ncbi:hypothetical protein ABT173_24570 [Streptomyces sp. NPDC001795]|uniref:hypothetical protein n=1 Tax=Streptomyces sp. NPDC001795 TaxID=3154525 RepID=UPI00331B9F41